MQTVTVPDDALYRLKKGLDKLESRLNVKVRVTDNRVEIEGDPVKEYFAKDVVRALILGFKPNDAMKLTEEGYTLKVIDLKKLGFSESAIRRQLGRVIGEHGKAKLMIEKKGDVRLSISGHTVAIIGLYDDVEIVAEAIQRLITGSPHKNVYRFIDEAEIHKSLVE